MTTIKHRHGKRKYFHSLAIYIYKQFSTHISPLIQAFLHSLKTKLYIHYTTLIIQEHMPQEQVFFYNII